VLSGQPPKIGPRGADEKHAPELTHRFINMTMVLAARDATLGLAGMLRASLALAK
jgi:hypothetical protein